MAPLNLAYGQYIKGSNSKQNGNYYQLTPNIPFLDPRAQDARIRFTRNKINIDGHLDEHPVYELLAYDFDRWSAVCSGNAHVAGRSAGFSQFIAIDGAEAKADAEDMNKLRGAVAHMADYRYNRLFMDENSYEDVAERNAPLRSGSVSIDPDLEPMSIRSRAEAYFVMRVWDSCWKAMYDMRMNGTASVVERPVEMRLGVHSDDPVGDCADVFVKWIARVLPPQVMSMISVTVGAAINEDTWNDSVCRILAGVDKIDTSRRNELFNLENIYKGVPDHIVPPLYWEEDMGACERAIVDALEKHELSEFYGHFLERVTGHSFDGTRIDVVGMFNVALLADFDILYWCTDLQLALNEIRSNADIYRFKDAVWLLGNLQNRLLDEYGLRTADAHALLRDAEHAVAEKAVLFKGGLDYEEYRNLLVMLNEVQTTDTELAEKLFDVLSVQRYAEDRDEDGNVLEVFDNLEADYLRENPELYRRLRRFVVADFTETAKGELTYAEYMYLTGMYREASSDHGGLADEKLAEALLSLLGAQFTAEDAERGTVMLAQEDEIRKLEKLYFEVLDAETLSGVEPQNMTGVDFETWAIRHSELENEGRRDTVRRLEEKLSECLSLVDHADIRPVDLAKKHGLENVVRGIMRNTVRDLNNRKRGILDSASYRELLAYYVDDDYPLDAEHKELAGALLTGQTVIGGDTELPDALLRKEECIALWNRNVRFALDSVKAMKLDDETVALWIDRSGYESCDRELRADIAKMVAAKADATRVPDYIDDVRRSKEELPELETELIRRGIADANSHETMQPELYRWWLETYRDQADNVKPCADETYGLLRGVKLRKGESDILDLAGEAREWRLLGDLVLREIGEVGNLNSERFEKWVRIYKSLQENPDDVDPAAVKACEKLLSTKITFNTMTCLQENDIRGELYWSAMRTLLEQQKEIAGVMRESRYKEWLSYLSDADRDDQPIADDILSLLGSRLTVKTESGDSRPTFDIMVEVGCTEGRLKSGVVRAELEAMGDKPLRNMDEVRRWLGYYAYLKTEDETLEKQAAEKICERPVVDNRYILGTVLEAGAEELEESLLEAESSSGRPYSEEEYKERLSRYFHGHCTGRYQRLLVPAGREEINARVRLLVEYWGIEPLTAAGVNNAGALIGKLVNESTRFEPDTLRRLIAMAGTNDSVQSLLRSNQEQLEYIVAQCFANNMLVNDIGDLTRLMSEENRVSALSMRIASDLAAAIAAGEKEYDLKSFNETFPGAVPKETAVFISNAIEGFLPMHEIHDATILNAMSLVRHARVADPSGIDIICKLLKSSVGPIRVSALFEFAFAREQNGRTRVCKAVAEWMTKTSGQESGTLDDIIDFIGKVPKDDVADVTDALFEGTRAMLRNGYDCSHIERTTYDRICELWENREGFETLRVPVLDGCRELTGVRDTFVTEQLSKGPYKVEERYAELTACRNRIEVAQLVGVLTETDSVSELSDRVAGLKWLNEETFNAISGDENLTELINKLVDKELSREENTLRTNGDPTPKLTALTGLSGVIRNAGLNASLCAKLSAHLNVCVKEQAQKAFAECVQQYDNNAGNGVQDSLSALGNLLREAGTDNSAEISAATTKWCSDFAAEVITKSRRVELFSQIHSERPDLKSLRLFTTRVYEQTLRRREMGDALAYALLQTAKVQSMNDIWNRYLALAIKLPEGKGIWTTGKDEEIAMNVVYVFSLLDGIADKYATKESLSDYCSADEHFAKLAKKLKNKELARIASGVTTAKHRIWPFG